jgi:hypothetical protein
MLSFPLILCLLQSVALSTFSSLSTNASSYLTILFSSIENTIRLLASTQSRRFLSSEARESAQRQSAPLLWRTAFQDFGAIEHLSDDPYENSRTV